MAVKIRLKLMGKKKKHFFRVVVADESTKRNGKVLATLGYYDPTTNPATVKIDKKALSNWQQKGAQPTAAVQKLLNI